MKGQELRQLVARYSFCNGSSGHRLKDIEKIVTGMFMRSTDFADLREMLVNCIEENRDSIALELQMETLDSWHKKYRAYQEAESERDKIERLNQLENDLLQVELRLGELQYRLQCLCNQNEQSLQQEQEAGNACNRQLEQLRNDLASQQQQDNLHIEQLKLQGYLGTLTSKISEIQPDPALIENREAKQEHLTNIQQQKQDAEKTVIAIETETKKNQALIDAVFSDKRKRTDDKQRIQDTVEQLQKQLDANPDTLLGFLRDHQPDWINNIAKVINPDLLLRDDLEPALQVLGHTFYGLIDTLEQQIGLYQDALDEKKTGWRLKLWRDTL